jgi:hypothetical protein
MYIRIPRRHRLLISVNAPSHYEVADVTRRGRAEYAKRCDADFIEILDDAHEVWGMANKWRIQRYAEGYYQTAYFDGDVIIKPDAPNIFEAAESYKIMFRDELPIIRANNSPEYVRRLHEWAKIFSAPKPDFSPNAGVMVIPQNMIHLYHPPEQSVKTDWCLDQYYLAALLTKNKLLDKIAFLGEEYHLMYIQSDFWSKLPNCKIIHLNGSQNGSYRLELAKRIEADNFDFFRPSETTWVPNWPELRKK